MPSTGEGTLQVLSFIKGDSASGRLQSYKLRKAHRKSQKGCVICKRRRVKGKCDEQAPTCQNCVKYGVGDQCSYKAGNNYCSELIPVPQIDKSVQITVLTDWFPNVDSKLFEYFLTVVVGSTMPIPSWVADAPQKVISIAMAEPHAMHSTLAVAACHWRYHRKSYRSKCPSEMFHSMKACAGLRQYLETPQRAKIDVDTAMTTSMFLGSVAFADATEDLEVPLEERTVPFHWLRTQLNSGSLLGYFQSNAKMESICLGIFGDITQDTLKFDKENQGTSGIPRAWATLFEVEETFISKQHRYLSVLSRLCHLLSLNPGNELALLQYMQFMEGLSSPFVVLLNTLDIRALLLLSYWLALLCAKDCWWSRVRASIDCWEICKYLEKNGDESLWRYMDFPAVACDYPYASSSSAGRHLVDRLRQERSQFVDHHDPIRKE